MSVEIIGNNIYLIDGLSTKTIYGSSIIGTIQNAKGRDPLLVVRTLIDDYTIYLKDTGFDSLTEFETAVVNASATANLSETVTGTVSTVYYSNDNDIVFQVVSSTETTTVTVLNSLDGTYWATAVDESGEDITGDLVAGTTPLVIPITNPRGLKFKLSFAANSGNITITTTGRWYPNTNPSEFSYPSETFYPA